MNIPTPKISSWPGMSVDDLRKECGYQTPPAELALPHYNDDRGGASWKALERWFREHMSDDFETVYAALTVYLADRHGLSLDDAEDLAEEYRGNVDEGYN